MDKNPLISRLNKALPGATLEVRRFGRSHVSSIWVETQSIQKVARFVKEDSEYKLDWLENLSVVEFEGVFVVSYFLRSTETHQDGILRVSIVPASANARVDLPSIQEIWPMGQPMEREAAEMFGIRFESGSESDTPILPEGWSGYPLRKNYSFPKEFSGITHSRPFNTQPHDKRGNGKAVKVDQ